MSAERLHNKLEKIRSTFESFLELGSKDDLKVVLTHLENTNQEFRSVAFEAVANALAIKDLESGNSLMRWKAFMEGPAIDYLPQVHSGLGWALAKMNFPYTQLSEIEYFMRSRVLDGCGYHDGIFRARRALKLKLIPEGLNPQQLSWYDQGLGRSLWYSGLGDVQKISAFITGFPSDRHASLWRGVGHAAAFAGGCDQEQLNELHAAAGIHAKQLAIGTATAARGRMKAGCMSAGTELACRSWWGMSAAEITAMTDDLLPLMISENIYDVWLQEIGERVVIHDLINK